MSDINNTSKPAPRLLADLFKLSQADREKALAGSPAWMRDMLLSRMRATA